MIPHSALLPIVFVLTATSVNANYILDEISREEQTIPCPGMGISGESETGDLEWDGADSPWKAKVKQASNCHRRHSGQMAGEYACPLQACMAVCRALDRRTVPQNLPVWIEQLDLTYNLIDAIGNGSFSKFPDLLVLDLRFNFIQRLYPESFVGLSKLRFLDLRYNELMYFKKTYPPNVFQPLGSLIFFKMSKNNRDPTLDGLEYPADELSVLTSLQLLSIDGLKNPTFSKAFRNLTALKVLSLNGYSSGNCHLSGLDDDVFIHLSQVKCLYLSSCFIQGKNIKAGAFKPLTRLERLDLTHNEDIGVENLPTIFSGFRNTSTLRYLGLHLIVPRYSLGICLTHDSLRFFPQSVEFLNAQENSLEAVSKHTVSALPEGLKVLDLSGNDFVFGRTLRSLHELQSLHTLKLNGREFVYELPKRFPFKPSSWPSAVTSLRNQLRKNVDCLVDYDDNSTMVVRLPPVLRYLEMKNAGLLYRLTEMHFDRRNALEAIDLTGNKFPSLEGPWVGLHSLKKLDLSSCYVKNVMSTFFRNITSLIELNLQWNSLGEFFESCDSDSVFSYLVNLEILNLSSNNIKSLRTYVFHGLNNLKTLDLNMNPIMIFSCDVTHMSNLHFLKLENTGLPTLDENVRLAIDGLVRRGVPVNVCMSGTPISCECHNLHFLEWMASSKAFNSTFQYYQCFYSDMTIKELTEGYGETIDLLRRMCEHHVYLLLVVSLSVTLTLVIVGVSICYRFRWDLRYLYHVAYLHYKKENRNRSGAGGSREFEYDVFVCYANEDEDFVVDALQPEMAHRGLSVYLHGRHFVAGEQISSNIVAAVCRCRKTLVVITPAMVNSRWCNYEIQMANMEAVHTGRKVLVFLLKGSSPTPRDRNLFYNIKVNTYLECPSRAGEASEEQMQALWDKLARDLQD